MKRPYKYLIIHVNRPAFSTHNGQKYLHPGWIPVEDDVTFDDVTFDDVTFINPYGTKSKKFKVIGSAGNIYTVRFDGKSYSCDCPGAKFHGTCKHIKKIQEEYAI